MKNKPNASHKKACPCQRTQSTTISSLRFIVTGCEQESCSNYRLDTPQNVHAFWKKEIQSDPTLEPNKEHLIVILLNTINAVVGYTVVSTGTVSESMAYTRDILRPVIVGGTKHFIMIHNHPSGNPSPSEQDYSLTRQVNQASHLMNLTLRDHLITCSQTYFSFKELGMM